MDSGTSEGVIHGHGRILSGAVAELFGISDIFPDRTMYCEASKTYSLLNTEAAHPGLSTLNT